MKIEKLKLTKEKVNINLQFYFFLKTIVKLKPKDKQISLIIEKLNLFSSNLSSAIYALKEIFVKSTRGSELIEDICTKIQNFDDVNLFIFSLKLYQIKGLLLEEAKTFRHLEENRLSSLHPLSLEYDAISVLKPYQTRVTGALLSLLFFEKLNAKEVNFMSTSSYEWILELSKSAVGFKERGLESNQIFMLMFNESINQSIISDSGSNYEDRIKSVLEANGINNIYKVHDKNDKALEYDLFFKLDNKTYGIGAKRTLRERYKQFIKTSQDGEVDIMIEVTIGLDLNNEKAKIITEDYGIYIFVSDEVYQTRNFLKSMQKVYSTKDLNIKTLKELK